MASALLLIAAAFTPVSAQQAAAWRVAGEVGGVVGGTWLKGVGAPTVATDPGATVGITALHVVAPGVSVGGGAHVGSQPVVLREVGSTWSGGTLTETDVFGVFSFLSNQGTLARLSLDVGAGLALLSGARTIVPFRDANRIAPLLQADVSFRRRNDSPTARDVARGVARDVALFIRAGVVRLGTGGHGATATSSSGWIPRFGGGVKVSR